MPSVIVVGAQWGDEGKGKIVDLLTSSAKHVIRAQGGNNAGHTVLVSGREFKLHLIPSGILFPHACCYIGSGCVLDPQVLLTELETLEKQNIVLKNRFFISEGTHVIFPYHKSIDMALEKKKGKAKVGTTGRGIGPCYADKINRIGIRMGELISPSSFKERLEKVLPLKNEELTRLYEEKPFDMEEVFQEYSHFANRLKPYVCSIEKKVADSLKKKENVILEGAQGAFLDVTHGTYPYVTSSNTLAGGIVTGAGIGPTSIDHTLGVIKAYTTRVGEGPFPTETREGVIFQDYSQARELGTTTGRKRRAGWFDVVMVKEAIWLNGLNSLAITKLDILDHLKEILVCVEYKIGDKTIDHLPKTAGEFANLTPVYQKFPGWESSTKGISTFEKLPKNAQNYLKSLESFLEIPISIVSTGPERESSIILTSVFS